MEETKFGRGRYCSRSAVCGYFLNGAPDGAQFLSRADQMFPQRDGKFFLSTENLTSRRALIRGWIAGSTNSESTDSLVSAQNLDPRLQPKLI